MKIADIELRAEFLLRFRTELTDAKLAQLVGERLRRHGDVAVNFQNRLFRRVRGEVVDGLLPRPAELVNSGVDDQAHGPKALAGQLPALDQSVQRSSYS